MKILKEKIIILLNGIQNVQGPFQELREKLLQAPALPSLRFS